ncbi:hypothetical protein BU17DRAFT_88545 [Hysterangium stoloniferum]|nr:hypothetical protein BU17DRAFT_88545 [Hysterangium stoloniferum]
MSFCPLYRRGLNLKARDKDNTGEFKADPGEIPFIGSPPLTISTVEDLASIDNLPSLISYSPLNIPLPNGQHYTLLRRDLFDARFQLISESSAQEASEKLTFIDAPSDLVPGVYEGGLKTWECSIDLAAYLHTLEPGLKNPPCNLLEVGCGTAVPSLIFLHKLFQVGSSSDQSSRKVIHLQDYNSVVLQLVTLPNVILAWYSSPASESYRAQEDPHALELNFSEAGELALSPELLSAFTASLQDRNIGLNFISGSWNDTDTWIREKDIRYDLVLSSETIYRMASLPSFIALLRSSSRVSHGTETGAPQDAGGEPPPRPICLVAAKVIYFGVGGGVMGFERAIEEAGGQCITVFEQKAGVSRRIMQIIWP